MYSTCVFCNRPLGSNQVIEAFPVGRRVAFDEARGRLWVVCRGCERWNLSPMEERWEAVEDCERLFREVRARVSTENIGLAKLPEGLELVRIGKPLRPEFAAWRYGDQFGRRRKRNFLIVGGVVAASGVIVTAGMAAGVISTGLLAQSGNLVSLLQNGRTRLKLRTEDGRTLKLKNPDLLAAKIRTDTEQGWQVEVGRKRRREIFTGVEAERVAGLVVPKLNSAGGNQANVAEAVRLLEGSGGPEPFLREALRPPEDRGGNHDSILRRVPGKRQYVSKLPKPTRLAIEMALHEEQERRALEGELRVLEAAWREAEEIAAIADDLLLPSGARDFLESKAQPAEAPEEDG